MKRSRVGVEVQAAGMRPVLGVSSKLNQIQPSSAASMSYKELIKVVGVDCETGPSSWRKAIDHSAETVVFFQVDLRGTVPRMAKSVRVCREEGTGENKGLYLVPCVYVGDTLLSSTYVKTIIGRRFLADEDDLMKLLEHAGILRDDQEIVEDQHDQNMHDDWGVETAENDIFPEPEPKKAKASENSQVVSAVSRSGLRPRTTFASETFCRKDHKDTRSVVVPEKGSLHSHSESEVRPPIDLTPMFLFESIAENVASSRAKSSVTQQDVSLDPDFDVSGLPAENGDDDDDLPLGFDMATISDLHGNGQETVYTAANAETEQGAVNEQAGYRFPFQVPGKNKELLIEGFCEVWIEKSKKSLFERGSAGKPKSEGAFYVALCRTLIRDKDARGIREMLKRVQELQKDGARNAGVQRIFGTDFIDVIKAYAGHVGFAPNGDRATRAMNDWKKREFLLLKKDAPSEKT